MISILLSSVVCLAVWAYSLSLASAIVRAWVWLTTIGLPPGMRHRSRTERLAMLHDRIQYELAQHSGHAETGFRVFVRWILGIPGDLFAYVTALMATHPVPRSRNIGVYVLAAASLSSVAGLIASFVSIVRSAGWMAAIVCEAVPVCALIFLMWLRVIVESSEDADRPRETSRRK